MSSKFSRNLRPNIAAPLLHQVTWSAARQKLAVTLKN